MEDHRVVDVLGRGDNRAPNFRVELRALEPVYGPSYVAINVRYWGKTDTAHGLKADHA